MSRSGSTALRNPKVAKAFEEMDLFESWGTGLRRIRESCAALDLPAPEFLEIGDMFRVNLFRATLGSTDPKTDLKKASEKQTDIQGEILNLLEDNPYLTRNELAAQLSLSRTTIGTYIGKLRQKGLLEYVGSARTGHWVVKG
ncbi:MAG: winged helix-turn-helix transcriptional regulator [Coriobacteriia bacterium]|nr:winged helix-turn-helix transcriptional regulator [Coriobacteriia bacterium]